MLDRSLAWRVPAATVVLGLLLAACGTAPPAEPSATASAGQSVASSSPAVGPTAATTMRAEAAAYGRHYCAAIEAWNAALDHAADWSSAARLEPAMARTPDPETAASIKDMRTEIAAIATYPPVVPIARALTKAADRLERVVGLLGPVMAGPGKGSSELDQDLPRLSADMSSAAEFHRVAEGSYGPLDCPPDARVRVGDPEGVISVATPGGWRLFGPSNQERQAQFEAMADPDYADRVRDWADFADPSAAVLYDAAKPGSSGIGAVVWMSLDPGANDLLGSMELLEAELSSDASVSDVVVRYVDRPAGDAARLMARATIGDEPDSFIVDVIRVAEGIVIFVSIMPAADAPTYWLALEQIVGSLRVDGATDPQGEA